MKRRTDCSKFRRPIKKSKIAEGLSSNTLLYMKFLILWAIVITADFLVEFRFEFLWPFWLLLRSVHDSFKYKGLAFSILFVCIAFTSDLICLFFIPAQWLFFVASTYVWVQFVWHTDRGVCLPTIILWVIFVYLEAAIRWKDSRNMPHLDLCRPFAAHCIGYPVVTLGFGFKSYVGYRIRQRKQREVAKENDFYMQLLQQALPQEEAPPSLSQSDQQLQPQEKDPIVVATGNHNHHSSAGTTPSSSSAISNNNSHHIKNAQNNTSKLLNNNNSSSSPPSMTNGHAIGAAASLLFGLSSSMSMTSNSNTNSSTASSASSATSSVISNGVGYSSHTQQISNPASSSNSLSSSSVRHRKSVDNKESSGGSGLMTSLNSGSGKNSSSNNNTFHHSNHISLNNNKDRSSPNDNLSTSYDFNSSIQQTKTHDKDSPKQHYQLSNSTTNASSSYDDAFGAKSSEQTTKSSNKLQQNGNLQHYAKQDYELPQQSMCQQTEQPMSNDSFLATTTGTASTTMTTTTTTTNTSSNEKERTKSGRKGRGNKGNKNSATETATSASSFSSSKDNHNSHQQMPTSVTNNSHHHHNNTSTSSSNHNNTQQHESLFQTQYLVCNNKDHVGSKACESCPKFEVEVKKLKLEINSLKQSENEVRLKSESNATTVKSCLQVKQKENDELHSKLQDLNNVRQVERQTMQNLERRLTEERRLRQSLEAQLNNERKYRKQAEEKAARSECTDSCRMKKQQLESDVNKIRREYAAFEEMKHNVEKQTQRYEQELRKMEVELRNREQQQHSDLITVNDLRMKNATLEKNLSAETRVKLDLFSALGESKRDIEMRDSILRERNNELLDLKAKIAQLLAVMPSMPDTFGFATSMHHELSGMQSPQQQQQQQQQQSDCPLGHLVLIGGGGGGTGTGGVGPSSLVLDPNAKTYTPKNTSSLIGGAEA